ncbi:hypothetical protein [Saccharomonospora sp. CUA-673]|uniref:hypothetical protein n=1 Tax=Saccharomonospora sp. CUA-673 TaxID=1904969 RepID=UPI0011153EBC|nr:hypothetical protein [Saccharomonospora sp. CUA-673]
MTDLSRNDRASAPATSHAIVNTVFADRGSNPRVAGRDVIENIEHHHYNGIGSEPMDWDLQEARLGFVQPRGYVEIQQKFLESHVVVLSATRGTGRHTGALNLLAAAEEQVRRDGSPIREFRRLRPSWLRPQAESLPRLARYGYLLDLSDSVDKLDPAGKVDARPSSQFGASLKEHAAKLSKLGSFLVVLVTPEVWQRCETSAQSITVSWQKPCATDVAIAALRNRFRREDRIEWLHEPPFSTTLTEGSLSPTNATRLASAISRAEQSEDGTVSAQKIAIDEFRNWSEHLRTWFREKTDIYDRAILIAAAALGRALDQEIVNAADNLLEVANEENTIRNPLRAPDLVERLASTGADIGLDHFVSLNDKRPGFDTAVLDHVWRQRPKLHPTLLDWLVRLATADKVSRARRERIASVIAGLGIRRGISQHVVDFARNQAKVGHRELAVMILNESVLDPGIGSYVRNRISGWASSKDPLLLDLAAAVCGGRIGIERTDLALTRLGRVLTNPHASLDVLRTVGRALGALAERDDLRPSVMETVTAMLTSNPRSGAQMFLEIATYQDDTLVVPRLIRDANSDEAMRATLVQCWQESLTALGPGPCARAMDTWIGASEAGKLDEGTVLAICMPVLHLDTDLSLATLVFKHVSDKLHQKVMRDLMLYHRQQRQTQA